MRDINEEYNDEPMNEDVYTQHARTWEEIDGVPVPKVLSIKDLHLKEYKQQWRNQYGSKRTNKK